ncbi:MAG TPA: hypothetical protein VEI07_12130 [Planctomycetaceae bacterium]|nr:hypothetical protein [Planctomycetaceae bacterium]
MRVIVAFILAAFSSMTPVTLAGDVAPASAAPANDPVAERILRQARGVLAGAGRLELDCEYSQVEHESQTEDLYRVIFYLENPTGYLHEIRPIDVRGRTSRAREKSGRPYRLASRPGEATLYAKGVVTSLNHQFRTYEISKEETEGELKQLSRPANFSTLFIPWGMHWFFDWDQLRAEYSIQLGPSTPTTVGIVLSLRPQRAGFDLDKLQPERHEIVLDRRTLLPKSWRVTRGGSDNLITYHRFDLNPAARPLKVPAGYTKGDTLPLFATGGMVMVVREPTPAEAKAAAKEEAEFTAEILLAKSAFCALCFFHLF